MHGSWSADLEDINCWPEPYRNGYQRARTEHGRSRWKTWASRKIYARYRARCAERRNAAIALLEGIIRRESVWWVNEEPTAGEARAEDAVFA